MGRPLKFKSAEEIEKVADEYFLATPINQWTITGLALALDTDRVTLINYENRDDFFNTIKKLKTKIENSYELTLRTRGSAGDIFGLKNFGWRDKTEQDISVKELPKPILGGQSVHQDDSSTEAAETPQEN